MQEAGGEGQSEQIFQEVPRELRWEPWCSALLCPVEERQWLSAGKFARTD